MTVAQPELVTYDVRATNRENFYRVVAGRGTTRPLYLKVCITYGPTDGTIITAFRPNRIKRAEQTKWP